MRLWRIRICDLVDLYCIFVLKSILQHLVLFLLIL